jgi:hypothetical protein
VRPLNLPYLALNLLYWVALVVPPILLGLAWLGWFHSPRLHAPKWRIILLFSGQCAGTANFVLWWLGGLAAVSLQFRILENPRPG